MNKYIRDSIDRFKKDALSKAIYDIFKWLLPFTVVFAATHLMPKNFSFVKIISTKFEITFYWIVLYSLFLTMLSILAVRVIFKKKFNALQTDNFTDELTGLKNHKALKENLNLKLNEFIHSAKTLSLIIIDVDDFKAFNTNVGFNTADEILKKVGELLSNDKRATDETFRQFLRGDEFLVIATETSLHGAFIAAERKRELIQNAIFTVGDNQYKLTVSCGVTELKKDDDYKTITDRVNAALNEAKKQAGKNCTKSII